MPPTHSIPNRCLSGDTAQLYEALQQEVRSSRSYSPPEIIAIPIERGLRSYLDWIEAETKPARLTKWMVAPEARHVM